MRVIIYTHSYLPIPKCILLDRVKQLVTEYAASSENQIYIIGNDWPASFVDFCNNINQVELIAQNHTRDLFKTTINTSILHFGTQVKRHKNVPILFDSGCFNFDNYYNYYAS